MPRKTPPMIVRQGDVALIRVKSMPADAVRRAKENGRVILAHGEVTGHAHCVQGGNAALLDTPDGTTYLTIEELLGETGAVVVHEEHDTIPLDAGTYLVRRQRYYTPEAIRQVAD